MRRDYFNFIPIFNIHEVGVHINPWTISTQKFESFLKWMYEYGYTAASIDEMYAYYQRKYYPQDKFVLTFDDGRKGIINNVVEILDKYNASVTIYLVYDWVHQIFRDEKECYSEFMSIEDVKSILNSKITIGYHTKSHCDLTQLNKDEIIKETIDSRYLLEEELNTKINHFSFPYGKINDEISKILIEQGKYKTIVASDRTGGNNLYHLPRISLKQHHNEGDFEDFFRRISWANKK